VAPTAISRNSIQFHSLTIIWTNGLCLLQALWCSINIRDEEWTQTYKEFGAGAWVWNSSQISVLKPCYELYKKLRITKIIRVLTHANNYHPRLRECLTHCYGGLYTTAFGNIISFHSESLPAGKAASENVIFQTSQSQICYQPPISWKAGSPFRNISSGSWLISFFSLTLRCLVIKREKNRYSSLSCQRSAWQVENSLNIWAEGQEGQERRKSNQLRDYQTSCMMEEDSLTESKKQTGSQKAAKVNRLVLRYPSNPVIQWLQRPVQLSLKSLGG